uniref:RING-type domain-containing protein n=2 Tax=Dendroctonus ponderosae TaxID=77166 RepID=A0AAR5P8U4_DENPD
MAFPKAVFRRLWLKIQREELEKAEVDLIVSCPFCEFVVTPLAEASVFKCGKESCRLCTRKSHIPTRCSEVPLDKEVQIRTFLEDKWTEAVTRTCFSCKKSFIKTRGCNKMTCTCGASMCYICSQLISGYEHFDVLDGKCDLMRDESDINREWVRKHVESAKRALAAKLKQSIPQGKPVMSSSQFARKNFSSSSI